MKYHFLRKEVEKRRRRRRRQSSISYERTRLEGARRILKSNVFPAVSLCAVCLQFMVIRTSCCSATCVQCSNNSCLPPPLLLPRLPIDFLLSLSLTPLLSSLLLFSGCNIFPHCCLLNGMFALRILQLQAQRSTRALVLVNCNLPHLVTFLHNQIKSLALYRIIDGFLKCLIPLPTIPSLFLLPRGDDGVL